MLEIVDVEIDKEAIIPCPDREFKGRRAYVSCPNCIGFRGVILISESDIMDIKDKTTLAVIGVRPIRWDEKYAIRCSFPMDRRTKIVEVIEE